MARAGAEITDKGGARAKINNFGSATVSETPDYLKMHDQL